jgi:hypothetical protein
MIRCTYCKLQGADFSIAGLGGSWPHFVFAGLIVTGSIRNQSRQLGPHPALPPPSQTPAPPPRKRSHLHGPCKYLHTVWLVA